MRTSDLIAGPGQALMSPLSFDHLVSRFGRVCIAVCFCAAMLLGLPVQAAGEGVPLQLAQDDVGQPNPNLQILRQQQYQLQQVPTQRSVEVPDLRGMTFPEAETLASRRGLKLAPNEFQDISAPRFHIARQSPKPGTKALVGSWIRVDTEAWTQVPQLIDRTQAEARRLIERARLTAQVARTIEADVAQPVVQSQTPKPGTWVREKSQVFLVVARPFALVVVPEVVGSDPASAERRIQAAGLSLGQLRETEGDVREPMIARQDPPAGTRVEPGSSVRLLIVRPATPEPVVVPDLVGRSAAEAEALLRQRELLLERGRLLEGRSARSERIVAQRPDAGSRVEPGSSVTVDIEVPPPMGIVPDIVGLALRDAIDKVRRGGFSFETRGAAQIDETRDKVVAQDPPAGSEAPFGTTVVAQVERALVTVPEIVGRSAADARKLVESERLRFAPRGLRPVDPESQVIASQEPAAGSQVPPGTPVVARPEPPTPQQRPLVVVPDLRRLTVGAATSEVAAVGLELARQDADAPTQDRIERQSPEPGAEVERGSLVRVWLAAATVRVPDLTGLTRSEAARQIDDAGLKLSTQEADMPTRDEIARQDPEAGREVARGSLVRVWLAADTARVPDLTGLTRDEAARRIDDAGLRLSTQEADMPTRDEIAQQDPGAGREVAKGSLVRVWLAAATTRVPDLTGLNWQQAERLVSEVGLSLADTSSGERDSGTVVEVQQPAPGREVPLQTRVTVTLAAAPTGPTDTGGETPRDGPTDRGSDRGETGEALSGGSQDGFVLKLSERDLWWAAGGAGAVLLLLAGWMLVRPRGTRVEAAGAPIRLSFEVARDVGAQSIDWDAEPGVRCRLRLRGVADAGTQNLLTEEDATAEPVRRYG